MNKDYRFSINTEEMSRDRFKTEAFKIQSFFLNKNVTSVYVTHRYIVELDAESQGKDGSIPTTDINSFIEAGVKKSQIQLGVIDFWIRSEVPAMEFHLCNDSDLHFSTNDIGIVNEVKELWKLKGFKIYGDIDKN